MLISAFDIAMTATGCVLVDLPKGSDKFHLLDARVSVTQKNSTSEKVSNTVDSMRRADEVFRDISEFLNTQKPDLVVVEAMSWPRNAASSIKMAMVWGALAPILIRYPLIEVGPQDIKYACAKAKTASKAQVEAGVKSLGLIDPAASTEVLNDYVKKPALREHCWDAMGAVVTAMRTQKFGLIRAGQQK